MLGRAFFFIENITPVNYQQHPEVLSRYRKIATCKLLCPSTKALESPPMDVSRQTFSIKHFLKRLLNQSLLYRGKKIRYEIVCVCVCVSAVNDCCVLYSLEEICTHDLKLPCPDLE